MIRRVVTIGGGTGSFVLLSGLKKYPVQLSAIVAMTDDGGSTGVLRDELGVLPPGDVRQCLVALSESSEKMRELMNYRFETGKLKGHNFGNLFLSVLEKTSHGFLNGVAEASKILKVRGEVIPVTCSNTNLYIQLKNGKLLKGENQINHNFDLEKIGIKKIYLNPSARSNPQAIKKILEADLIIIGPGNFYCSLAPNLLVRGISQAICKSKAKVVLNCNLVNKKGHTENFFLDDYAEAINKYLGQERIDFVTFNTKHPPDSLIKKYKKMGESLVRFIGKARTKRTYKIISANLLNNELPKLNKNDLLFKERSLIRHHSEKLAKLLISV